MAAHPPSFNRTLVVHVGLSGSGHPLSFSLVNGGAILPAHTTHQNEKSRQILKPEALISLIPSSSRLFLFERARPSCHASHVISSPHSTVCLAVCSPGGVRGSERWCRLARGMSPSDLQEPFHSYPPRVQLVNEWISLNWRARMIFNTDRHAQSSRVLHFDAKNSLLHPRSKRPVLGFSATSQQGNRLCAHHPLD
jgi:hypothetical protein